MKGKEMTAAQKRVAIAKDVIAQIKLKKYVPRNGVYVSPTREFTDKHINQEMKPLIPYLGRCGVCAIGSAFLSAIRLFDEFKIQSSTGAWAEWMVLEKWFSKQQCELMELAFEDHGNEVGYVEHIPTPKARLIVIMRNIIRNRGIFKPTAKDFQDGRALESMA